MIDGAKALAAIRAVCGPLAAIQRCQSTNGATFWATSTRGDAAAAASRASPTPHAQRFGIAGALRSHHERHRELQWRITRRPQFSWTRIKGESDVKGGGGHGWVEASAGSLGRRGRREPGGRAESAPTARRLGRGPWRPASGGARAGNGTWCCGCCAASRWRWSREKSVWSSIAWRRGREATTATAVSIDRMSSDVHPRRRRGATVSSGCVERGRGRARRSTRGALVCGAHRPSGVMARGAAGRRPHCRMRSCWRPFALTWPAHRGRGSSQGPRAAADPRPDPSLPDAGVARDARAGAALAPPRAAG